jgi:hypothetical protein
MASKQRQTWASIRHRGQQLALDWALRRLGKGVMIVFVVDADMTPGLFVGCPANLQEAVAVLGSGNCIAQFSLFSC